MRILIADDNDWVRRGVRNILASMPHWEVCGEAKDGPQAIQRATELLPDLILLDVSMPGLNGLDVARLLREKVPATKILIMSQHDPVLLLPRALEAGAHACVDKGRVRAEKRLTQRFSPFSLQFQVEPIDRTEIASIILKNSCASRARAITMRHRYDPMPIDAHQHFWMYSPAEYDWIDDSMAMLRRDFLPDDFKPVLESNDFHASVAVQARQTLEETRWLLELAERSPWILGVIGWADLRSPDIRSQLNVITRNPKLVGIRHIVQSEPDDRFLLQPDFLRGISVLEEFDLAYDILIRSEEHTS